MGAARASRRQQGRGSGCSPAAMALVVVLSAVVALVRCADPPTFFPVDDFFLVGGDGNWTFSPGYQEWADSQTFNSAGFIFFGYSNDEHDVVKVTKAAFDRCDVSNPIKIFTSGADFVALEEGINYFTCSFQGHCPRMKFSANVVPQATSRSPPASPSESPFPSWPLPAPSPALPSSPPSPPSLVFPPGGDIGPGPPLLLPPEALSPPLSLPPLSWPPSAPLPPPHPDPPPSPPTQPPLPVVAPPLNPGSPEFEAPSPGTVPDSSPPPPAHVLSPPPPRAQAPPVIPDPPSPQAGKKEPVPVTAIVVPIAAAVAAALATGVICWLRIQYNRESDAAAKGGASPLPPQSPLPLAGAASASSLVVAVPMPAAYNNVNSSGTGGGSAAGGLPSSAQNSSSTVAIEAQPARIWPPSSKESSRSPSSSNKSKSQSTRATAGTKIFSYAELCEATHNFSKDHIIGKGGFGVVYKGLLPAAAGAGAGGGAVSTPPVPVAIKVARARRLDSLRAQEAKRQLLNEVDVLSRAKHANLVRLLGCCIRDYDGDDEHGHSDAAHDVSESEAELLLVFEFVPNGTLLQELVRSRQGYPTRLDWAARMKLAVQIADALKYLHVHVRPPIFHRDVKSANIMLDADWNAKVADFGLSKLKEDEAATHISTMVKGTPGYLDPEYLRNNHLTDKSDVYSLGVVLLELLTARKAVERETTLATMAVPLIMEGKVMAILDHQLATSLTSRNMLNDIQGVAQVAVACLLQDTPSRPSMSQVVEMLQTIRGSSLRPEDFVARANKQGAPGRWTASHSSESSGSNLKSDSSWGASST